MFGKISAALIAGAIGVAGAPALAADFEMADATVVATEAVPPGGGWDVKVTPYGWMTGINGTITARGRSVSTAMSFIDLIQDSDKLIPFMGAWSVGKDRFSIFGDFFYSQIGFSAEKSMQVNPVAGLELSAKGKAGLTTTLTIAQVALAYDVIKQGGTSVGFYAGARYWYTDADLTLKITGEVNLSNLGLKRKGKYALARQRRFRLDRPAGRHQGQAGADAAGRAHARRRYRRLRRRQRVLLAGLRRLQPQLADHQVHPDGARPRLPHPVGRLRGRQRHRRQGARPHPPRAARRPDVHLVAAGRRAAAARRAAAPFNAFFPVSRAARFLAAALC